MRMVKLVFIRHGECDDQAFLRGHVNSNLTALGQTQMQAQVDKLQKLYAPDAVFSSDLKRCALFAQQWCHSNHTSLQVDSGWREINFGLFDGLSFKQLEQQYPKKLQQFLDSPYSDCIPEQECFADFKNRILKQINGLLEGVNKDSEDQTTLWIFTHSGVMHAFAQEVLGMSLDKMFNLKVEYAGAMLFDAYLSETNNELPYFQLTHLHTPSY